MYIWHCDINYDTSATFFNGPGYNRYTCVLWAYLENTSNTTFLINIMQIVSPSNSNMLKYP